MWRLRWLSLLEKIHIVLNEDDQKDLLHSLQNDSASKIVAFINAHAMNLCASDERMYFSLKSTDILLRDGSGMTFLYKCLGKNPGINMNGTDFIPRIFDQFRNCRVAIWGTQEPYLSRAVAQMEQNFGVKIVSSCHGFEPSGRYLQLARVVVPELIILGMGMPKQEEIAVLLQSSGVRAVIICGGAIIDFLGGKVSRAPNWMRTLGIEWIYRLLIEPERLWRRYILGNPAFLVRTLLLRFR